jgi:rhodanese-related sulfurtransferase
MEHIFKQFTLDYFAKGKQKTTFAAFLEQEDAVLVDVRSKEEALTLPIQFAPHDNVTAVNIPISEVPERMAEIPADKPVGLFCPATIRSAMVYALLLSNGYENVRILEGGYPALTEAVMPPKVLQAVKAAELLMV